MVTQALGKGLSALFEENEDENIDKLSDKTQSGNLQILHIATNQLRTGSHQPREIFSQNKLDELADSIRANGIIQPIVVRRTERDNIYQIIAGERRWRASKQIGLAEIPVIVVNADDKQAVEFALIENIQRQNLTPIEEGEGYRQLQNDFSYTQEQISKSVGKSRSHVANMLRLLDLPNDVKALINNGALTMGHARALLTAEDPSKVAAYIVENNLNVREAEKFAAGFGSKRKEIPANSQSSNIGVATLPNAQKKDEDLIELENNLSVKLGLKVIVNRKKDNGEVTIIFNNMMELDKITKLFH